VGQGITILVVVLISDKSVGCEIISIETSADSTDPEIALTILLEGVDQIRRKRVGIRWVIEEFLKGVAIITEKAILGTKPEKPVSVLKTAGYGLFVESLFLANPVKLKLLGGVQTCPGVYA
jgi:hypothetical protein